MAMLLKESVAHITATTTLRDGMYRPTILADTDVNGETKRVRMIAAGEHEDEQAAYEAAKWVAAIAQAASTAVLLQAGFTLVENV